MDEGAVRGDTAADEDIEEESLGKAEEEFIPGFPTFEAYSKVFDRIVRFK